MRAAELAARLGYEYVGDEALEIHSIAYASHAQKGDLAISRSLEELTDTKADVVLTAPTVFLTDKALIFTHEEITLSAVRATRLLIASEGLPDYTRPVKYEALSPYVLTGKQCIIGEEVRLDPWCVLGDRVQIGAHSTIEAGVWIGSDVIIGSRVTVHTGAKIGVAAFFHYQTPQFTPFPGIGTVRIGDNTEIGANATIERGTFCDTLIGNRTQIDSLTMIGHDVHIGDECRIVSQVGIAGEATIGKRVRIFGQAGIAKVRIQDDATIMGQSRITRDVLSGETVSGQFGRNHMEELYLQARLRRMAREKKEE